MALRRAALASAELNAEERVRACVVLSSALRRQGSWHDAEEAANAAVELAEELSDPRLRASSKLELGTLMLLAFEEERSLREADPLAAAMSNLDAAAHLYQSLGSIELYACLLAIGRALSICDDDPRGIYARITRDLVGPEWVARGARRRRGSGARLARCRARAAQRQ